VGVSHLKMARARCSGARTLQRHSCAVCCRNGPMQPNRNPYFTRSDLHYANGGSASVRDGATVLACLIMSLVPNGDAWSCMHLCVAVMAVPDRQTRKPQHFRANAPDGQSVAMSAASWPCPMTTASRLCLDAVLSVTSSNHIALAIVLSVNTQPQEKSASRTLFQSLPNVFILRDSNLLPWLGAWACVCRHCKR
jgi:hypothetical protein